MKTIGFIMLIISIMGCSHKNTQDILNKIDKSKQSTLTNEQKLKSEAKLDEPTRAFKNVFNVESLITILKQYNYRYKIVCVDTRNWTKNKQDILKTRRVVAKFGKKLGKKAIIANLIYKTSKKRDYVRKIQKKLNSYYNLDNQAPFLIFYKGNSKNRYTPYKIVSIASMSKYQLKKSLSLLTKAIISGKSTRQVYISLERITANMYASN